MGSRSGKRLTNDQKRANRKRREKIGKRRRPQYRNHPVPSGYFETYSALKEHIMDFLRQRKRSSERWATLTCKEQLTRSVVVLMGQRAMVDVSKIKFNGDNVSFVVSIHTKERSDSNSASYLSRIRPGSTVQCRHKEESWALGDPNLFDELDVLLKWAHDLYTSYEYPDGSND